MFGAKSVELSEKLTVDGEKVSKPKLDNEHNCLACNSKDLKIQLHDTKIVVEGGRRLSFSEEIIWTGTYDPNKLESFKFQARIWHYNIVKGKYPRLITGEHEVRINGNDACIQLDMNEEDRQCLNNAVKFEKDDFLSLANARKAMGMVNSGEIVLGENSHARDRMETINSLWEDIEKAKRITNDVIALRKDASVQEHFKREDIYRRRLS